MDWFQSKTGQIIALVSIVGTLAGFGYTGATYVNRLENLEAKIGGVDEAEDEMKIIEERFMAIETSVEYINKSIDGLKIPDVTEIKTDIATIKADLESLDKQIDEIKDNNKNPLAG
jgi:peptidoglycan hydrolase CwlO-like protein